MCGQVIFFICAILSARVLYDHSQQERLMRLQDIPNRYYIHHGQLYYITDRYPVTLKASELQSPAGTVIHVRSAIGGQAYQILYEAPRLQIQAPSVTDDLTFTH